MPLTPTLLFLDTETLGTHDDAPTWEVAGIRVDEYGDVEGTFQCFLELSEGHEGWLSSLPQSFQDDFSRRYNALDAMPISAVAATLRNFGHEAIVCGSNPSFDQGRLERLLLANDEKLPAWHYHPEDIPTLARGWLYGRGVYPAPPFKSDFISQACGVDPKAFDRHTAMGDCLWTYALWQQVSAQR